MITRRNLLPRLALLAAGGAAVWSVRDRLPWPPLEPQFADGRATPWLPIPAGRGLIEIAATVNGAPIRAVVDSGAQISAIDDYFAQRSGLRRVLAAPVLAYGVTGAPHVTHTVALDLGVAGLRVAGLTPAVLPLSDLAAASGRSDFHLLIGRDVLQRVVLEADFPRNRARFLTAETYRPPRDAREIPLQMRAGGPHLAVQVEGGAPVDVLVDTGSTGLLALSEAAARGAGLLDAGRTVSHGQSVSIGGVTRDRVVTARRLHIAGMALNDVDIQVFRSSVGSPAPTGLLGMGLLGSFLMGLDLSRRRLFLASSGLMVAPAGAAAREPSR